MQVDPIKTTLKAPGIKPLKLKHGIPLSNFGSTFNLRRHSEEGEGEDSGNANIKHEVGRCRLTL